jgi:glycine oxidase
VKDPDLLDYIIVGQGLAGSAAAMQLIALSRRILVIDEGDKNTSSRIAAGMFNPVTGKNPVKTWLADELFPYLHRYYKEAERLTSAKFFFPMPMYRPFVSVEEQNEWMGKSADTVYTSYIESVYASRQYPGEVNDPLGGLMLKQCGYLNTISYLKAVREYIAANGLMRDEHFDENALRLERDEVAYQGFRAKKIIFCQGYSGVASKWFTGLPLRPLKGETLTIKTQWKKDVILNRGVYMVPGSVPDEYRVGATYNFHDQTPGITGQGREELEEKLQHLIRFPYEVLQQDWGFRPTTHDHRPLLGAHPQFPQLIIFNGLGTKGVSLAPYFSDVLIRWTENKGSLNKDVAVTRYK